MIDPAIEAARRAWVERYGESQLDKFTDKVDDEEDIAAFVTAAAREMAKPIRELHRPMTPDELRDTWPGYVGVDRAVCAECTNVDRLRWLDECPTADCVYTTEELA
jgi:hypothetical protein